MRIAFLSASSELGGAERCLLDMIAAIRDQTECHLIVPGEGPLLELAEGVGVRAHVVRMPDALARTGSAEWASGARARSRLVARASGPALQYALALRRLVLGLRPTLVHSNGLKLHLFASFLVGRTLPVVWHLHDYLGGKAAPLGVIRAVPRPRVAIAVSRSVADDAHCALPKVPVETIYNAIDTDAFSPGPIEEGRLDHLAGLPPTRTIRVGLVATYARWKGHDVFLRAISELVSRGADRGARFYIIGGPIYTTSGSQYSRRELEERAHALGLLGRVGFVPFQRDPVDVYRALDVVEHASIRPEPFGRTIVEAMACAKPVVVSMAGGATELVEDGRNALGVAPDNAEALANSIQLLLSDPDQRAKLGTRARQTALERFSRARLQREIVDLFSRIVGRPTESETSDCRGRLTVRPLHARCST